MQAVTMALGALMAEAFICGKPQNGYGRATGLELCRASTTIAHLYRIDSDLATVRTKHAQAESRGESEWFAM